MSHVLVDLDRARAHAGTFTQFLTVGLQEVLADLRTTEAVEKGDWVSAGLGGDPGAISTSAQGFQSAGGASVAAAVPQVVQVAVEYGGKIAEKMGVLLSSTENPLKLVHGAVAALGFLDKVLSSIKSGSSSEVDSMGQTGSRESEQA
ncbi:hypothetical protein ACPZ19_44225 [Amycolatopsis lurida]